MKAFLRMTAVALLVATMLFVALPGEGVAGKVTLAEMVKIKKAADKAAQTAKAQAKKAKTDEEKQLQSSLIMQAEINADVVGDLLKAVKAGEKIDREEAEACAAIAKAVHEAAGALAAGKAGKARDVLDRIVELGSSMSIAANARANTSKNNSQPEPPSLLPPNIMAPYCANNNIMNPDGSIFARCGQKICVNLPSGISGSGGAGCVVRSSNVTATYCYNKVIVITVYPNGLNSHINCKPNEICEELAYTAHCVPKPPSLSSPDER